LVVTSATRLSLLHDAIGRFTLTKDFRMILILGLVTIAQENVTSTAIIRIRIWLRVFWY